MSGKKITVIAGLEVKPEFVSEFVKQAKIVTEATRKEAGCLRYDFYRDEFKPNAFAFVEEYEDADAFAAHRTMPYMTPFRDFRAKAVSKYLGVSELTELSHR